MKLEFINHQNNILLRDFLKKKISSNLLKDIKLKGKIFVNQEEKTVRYPLKENDIITLLLPKEEKGKQMIPIYQPLDIIYEDDYLLIINKQPNIACIPSRKHQTNTLAQAILYYYQEHQIDSTIHLVNRLDKETSGLMIVAKHRYIHYLCSLIPINRKYLAYVHGRLETSGTINQPIHREGLHVKRCVDEKGKETITHYCSLYASDEFSVIECQLETGRTHQIRVHLSYIGHPLLGDTLYGGSKEFIDRHALHSYYLSFIHPITHENMEFIIHNKELDLIKKIL